MPDTTTAFEQTGKLPQRLDLDEVLNAWACTCGPNELEAALRTFSHVSRTGRVTLILHLPQAIGADAAIRTVAWAGGVADRLVVVASEEDRARWGALAVGDLRALAQETREVQVLVEPDPERAVIGSMQWLRPHDTFFVVWPGDAAGSALTRLLAFGASWREAWDEPENGEFTAGPRGPERSTFESLTFPTS